MFGILCKSSCNIGFGYTLLLCVWKFCVVCSIPWLVFALLRVLHLLLSAPWFVFMYDLHSVMMFYDSCILWKLITLYFLLHLIIFCPYNVVGSSRDFPSTCWSNWYHIYHGGLWFQCKPFSIFPCFSLNIFSSSEISFQLCCLKYKLSRS